MALMDKIADSYIGFVLVAALRLWVRQCQQNLSIGVDSIAFSYSPKALRSWAPARSCAAFACGTTAAMPKNSWVTPFHSW